MAAGFTMTSDDNSKIYGITLIIWTALDAAVADAVEKRCEQWRQRHMTNEERELASSLGVRLAAERAHLSQLLAKLPTIPSGSSARDALDDQISTVEEKINLVTEMLRPLRHGAASKIDGLTAGETGLWVPRAFGILGRDATKMAFWKEWLRAVVVPMTDGAILRGAAQLAKSRALAASGALRHQPLHRSLQSPEFNDPGRTRRQGTAALRPEGGRQMSCPVPGPLISMHASSDASPWRISCCYSSMP